MYRAYASPRTKRPPGSIRSRAVRTMFTRKRCLPLPPSMPWEETLVRAASRSSGSAAVRPCSPLERGGGHARRSPERAPICRSRTNETRVRREALARRDRTDAQALARGGAHDQRGFPSLVTAPRFRVFQ